MTQADSCELKKHGVTAGLTNFAAAYATGLLCARRLLNLKKMDSLYEGVTKADGKLFSVMDEVKERNPFKAYLDIGLVRATTGNRSFGALKGAADGGLFVPHNEKRFPGFKVEKVAVVTNKRGKAVAGDDKEEKKFDTKVLKDHIFGDHVQTYYDRLQKEDANLFKRQFSNWAKCLTANKVKSIGELYVKVHAAIRKSPAHVKAAAKKPVRKTLTPKPSLVQVDSKGRKWRRQHKVASSVKKARIAELLVQIKAKLSN